MQLPELFPGTIIRRYKRFLADVRLADRSEVTAHCPNTGSMISCWLPGARVQLSRSDNPRRKLAWTLERVDMGCGWIGVHTGRTNAVVAEGIEQGKIPSLLGYREIQREVDFQPPALPRSRLDLFLSHGERPDAYIEVKNVTLYDGDRLRFPDAPTERGRKHLDSLLAAVEQGYRGVMLYALNRPEGACFAPAWEIDPTYAERLLAVRAAGVEVVAMRIKHLAQSMQIGEQVKVDLSAPGGKK